MSRNRLTFSGLKHSDPEAGSHWQLSWLGEHFRWTTPTDFLNFPEGRSFLRFSPIINSEYRAMDTPTRSGLKLLHCLRFLCTEEIVRKLTVWRWLQYYPYFRPYFKKPTCIDILVDPAKFIKRFLLIPFDSFFYAKLSFTQVFFYTVVYDETVNKAGLTTG